MPIKTMIFAKNTTRDEAEEMLGLLSPKEKEVLKHLSSGKTRVAVAQEMRISPKTYDQHLQHIKTKVGIKTLTGLVRLWVLARGF